MNPAIPPSARTVISICLSIAGYFHTFAALCAIFEGTAALSGSTSRFFVLPFAIPDRWVVGGHGGAAVASYLISLMAYGTGIMGDYVLARNRLALPAREMARLTAAEAGRNTLAIIAAIFLAAAIFHGSGRGLLAGAWLLVSLATGALAVLLHQRFHTRIEDWKKAWSTPAPDPLSQLPH